MGSPALTFNPNHPSYPYDLYVEQEAARYETALRARTAFLAKRNCRPSIHTPRLVECLAWIYSNKAERMAEAHRLARTPWPVFNSPIPIPIEPIPYTGKHGSRMKEWAEIRTKTSTNSAKFFANSLNDAHSAFMADELTSDEYADEIYSYLESQSSSDAVFAFLHSIQEKLADKTFCPEDAKPKFSTRINNAWKAYQQNNGVTVSPDDDQEHGGPVADDPALVFPPVAVVKEDYRVLKRRDNKAAVIDAYSGYLNGVVSESDFFAAIHKFALRKIGRKLKEYAKLGATEEDVAQEAALAVIKNLPNFKGEPAQFYSWLHRIVHTRGLDAEEAAGREQDRHAHMFLLDENGDEYENPGAYGDPLYKRNDEVVYGRNKKVGYSITLPDFIQGTDKMIWDSILAGKDYKQIAEGLGITVPAVTMRVAKMRRRAKDLKIRSKANPAP